MLYKKLFCKKDNNKGLTGTSAFIIISTIDKIFIYLKRNITDSFDFNEETVISFWDLLYPLSKKLFEEVHDGIMTKKLIKVFNNELFQRSCNLNNYLRYIERERPINIEKRFSVYSELLLLYGYVKRFFYTIAELKRIKVKKHHRHCL